MMLNVELGGAERQVFLACSTFYEKLTADPSLLSSASPTITAWISPSCTD